MMECQGTLSRLQTQGRLTFQFGTCCCDGAPDGTGHHSTPFKPRHDSLRLLCAPKIRGSSSGTAQLSSDEKEKEFVKVWLRMLPAKFFREDLAKVFQRWQTFLGRDGHYKE